jgi:hypothetical protein
VVQHRALADVTGVGQAGAQALVLLFQGQARSRNKQKELIDKLLQTIAADSVPERPGRREPRGVKRRPKPGAWLTKPRHHFKDAQHRNRYWKSKPRKIRA